MAKPGKVKRKPDARGLRLRLKPEPGVTPKKALRRPIYLPVVIGEDFEWSEDFAWEDFQTVGAGEFSSPPPGKRSKLLAGTDLETLAMYWDPDWMTFRDQDPDELRSDLLRIGRRHIPFRLVATLSPRDFGYERPVFRTLATLRSFGQRLPKGETDSRYYALSFREYRELSIKRRRHGGKIDLPTKHELKEGDTFRRLARRYYGKEAPLWKFLARRNGLEKWGGNDPIVDSKKFRVGDKVRIPEKPDEGGRPGGEDDDLDESAFTLGGVG